MEGSSGPRKLRCWCIVCRKGSIPFNALLSFRFGGLGREIGRTCGQVSSTLTTAHKASVESCREASIIGASMVTVGILGTKTELLLEVDWPATVNQRHR